MRTIVRHRHTRTPHMHTHRHTETDKPRDIGEILQISLKSLFIVSPFIDMIEFPAQILPVLINDESGVLWSQSRHQIQHLDAPVVICGADEHATSVARRRRHGQSHLRYRWFRRDQPTSQRRGL